MGHGAPVKGDGREKALAPAGPVKVLRRQNLRLLRTTPEDEVVALSCSSNDELGDRSTDTDVREVNVTRLSSVHKQIAHGSTRAPQASATFCTDCHARVSGKTLVTRATGQTHAPPLPLCPRQTRVTSTCSSCSHRSTHSLSCRQST